MSSAAARLAGFGCMGIDADFSSNYLTLLDPDIVSVGYTLDTAFGPVTTFATDAEQIVDIATSGGALTISFLIFATFDARTVPEPATAALPGLGLLGIGLTRRRTN